MRRLAAVWTSLGTCVIFFVLCASAASSEQGVRQQNARRRWKTLSGAEPLVIARGGLSGLLPDSTNNAYALALNNSLPNVVVFCDVQLSQDFQGICRTGLDLKNSTNIDSVFPNASKTYTVNGKPMTGYFAKDYTAEMLLTNLTAIQAISSRTEDFDLLFPLFPVEGLYDLQPPTVWLNVQYSKFFEDHKLSMTRYMESLLKSKVVDYLSSPEVEFLKNMKASRRIRRTKLIFRFLDQGAVDPSTNQTYKQLLQNLAVVKDFASGILVPKNYIWPVNDKSYLEKATTLVQDAHKEGLEVYAADFANDENGMSYNYSYDPVREYLQFIDNKEFSVDGFLTDFSVTASEAVACYAQNQINKSTASGNPFIISRNGASGDYPGCTDLAYSAAVQDGADIIDCCVQMTKDGVAICRESIDLMVSTNILSDSTFFPARAQTIAELQDAQGIFTFSLTWKEIQGLKPQLYSPYGQEEGLRRNPANLNAGKFMTLQDFLQYSKGFPNISVLVNIQNARYLAAKKGLDVTGTVISELKAAGFENMTDRLWIQSEDGGVLKKFRSDTHYKLIYQVLDNNATIPDSAIKQIKQVADGVSLYRSVIIDTQIGFLIKATSVVQRMHQNKLVVFVYRIRNEFSNLAFDYQADATMEINTLTAVMKVDGLITEFPATAYAYLNNKCRQPGSRTDYQMYLVNPGALFSSLPPDSQSQVVPQPKLSGVSMAPLPTVSTRETTAPAPAPAAAAASANQTKPSDQPKIDCHLGFYLLIAFVNAFILLC